MSEQGCEVCVSGTVRHTDVGAEGGRYPCCGGAICCSGADKGWTTEPLPSLAQPQPTASDLTPAEALVDEVLAAQRAKGRAKYGAGLDHADGHDWPLEALQELTDAVQYLAAEVVRLRGARTATPAARPVVTDDVLYAVEARMGDGKWARLMVLHHSLDWAEEAARMERRLGREARVVVYRRAEVVVVA